MLSRRAASSRIGAAVLYVGWILCCVVLFAVLSGEKDPARPADRITEREAVSAAAAALRAHTGIPAWELVHAAYSPASELREDGMWVVLLAPRTAERRGEPVVAEVNGRDRAFIRARIPIPRFARR